MTDSFKWVECKKAIASRMEHSFGWDKEKATQIAEIAADAVRLKYGGKRFFIPKKNGDLGRRLREEFNGRNIAELSARHGVSSRTVRRHLEKK